MKGLLLSLLVFACYVVSTAIVSHVVRVERHSKLFIPALVLWLPTYFLIYRVTPSALGFLPRGWIATYPVADAIYGAVVLVLNVHSYMDFFFGFNGGFSTSILVRLMRAEPLGLSLEQIIACYRLPDGSDKLFAWRLPRLAETGYIVVDPISRRCALTPKGELVARAGLWCKKLLGLGKGG